MASIDPNLLKRYPNAITQADVDQRNRFLGVLAGLAVGDALGAPHEFAKEEELALTHPRGPRAILAGAAHPKGAPERRRSSPSSSPRVWARSAASTLPTWPTAS